MPLLGAHVSTSGGLWTAFDRAEQLGCEATQIFTKSARQWKAPPFKPADVERFRQRAAETGIVVVSHASYLINLASPHPEIWFKSVEAYQIEMERCRTLGIPYLVMHPGAHTGSGYLAGIQRVAEAINREHAEGDDSAMLLLEITAGTGTSLGWELAHFEGILELVNQPERVGICFDTCHAVGAGWDIISREGYEGVMEQFDARLGLDRIRCFHLNDSQHTLGARRDRHTHIGFGSCTLEPFRFVLNDSRFDRVPMILETPKDDDLAQDVVNLKVLRALLQNAEEPVTADTLELFWEGVSRTEGKDE